MGFEIISAARALIRKWSLGLKLQSSQVIIYDVERISNRWIQDHSSNHSIILVIIRLITAPKATCDLRRRHPSCRFPAPIIGDETNKRRQYYPCIEPFTVTIEEVQPAQLMRSALDLWALSIHVVYIYIYIHIHDTTKHVPTAWPESWCLVSPSREVFNLDTWGCSWCPPRVWLYTHYNMRF